MRSEKFLSGKDLHKADRIFLFFLIVLGVILVGLSLAADYLGLDNQQGIGLEQVVGLVGGCGLVFVGWYFLSPRNWNENKIWLVVIVSILLLGTAIRVVDVFYDTYDYDEYHLMVDVDRSFMDYARENQGAYQLHYITHYWFSYRIFGGSLIGYRFMSLVSGIALLVLIAVWLRRFWPSKKAMAVIVMFLLALNGDALFLSSRYAMFVYANTYLVSAGLFFLFFRLSQGKLGRRYWLMLSLLFIPAAYFSNVFIIIPIVVGSLLVLVFRWQRFSGSRSVGEVWRWVWELKPLLIFPVTNLLQQLFFPFTNWGAGTRADQSYLFFSTSTYPANFLGVIRFLLERTYSLFRELLVPAGLRGSDTMSAVFLVVCSVLVIPVFYLLIRRKAGLLPRFTFSYISVILLLVALGGLLGFHPYGAGHYLPYLTLPSLVLIGLGGNILYSWWFSKPELARIRSAVLVTTTIGILIGGTYLCVSRHEEIVSIQKENQEMISWIEASDVDLMLSDSYISKILYTKSPQSYRQIFQMGWGTYWGEDPVPPEMDEMLSGDTTSPETILVILHPAGLGRTDEWQGFAQRLPEWQQLIEANYDLDIVRESPQIWAALYHRK